MTFHQMVSENGGDACLRCAVHVAQPGAVITKIKVTGRHSHEITAEDLANQVACHLHSGEGHHLEPEPREHRVRCSGCGLTIGADTVGDIEPTCPREDDTP